MSARGGGGGGQFEGLTTVLLTAAIVFIVLFVGLSVLSTVVETTTRGANEGDGESIQTAVTFDSTGQFYRIDNSYGEDETVFDSRGDAVYFGPTNDSFVESDQDIQLSDGGNWTVSVWGSLNTSAAPNELRTLLNIDGQLMLVHNGSSDEWVAYYYDEGSRDGTNVSVAAPNQPGSLTNIQVVRRGDEVTIYRNTTAGETASVSSSSPFAAPVAATDWHGRLEELRIYDDALSSSVRNDLYTDPNGPTTGHNQTARIMFDEPSRDSQRIFYSPATLQQSNVTFRDGVPGQELDEGSMSLLGSDYEWSTDGPQLKPLEGGRLDGAPVAYVDYTRLASVRANTLLVPLSSALTLAGMIPILLILGYIVATFGGLQRGRGR